jgi:hypothetical protein
MVEPSDGRSVGRSELFSEFVSDFPCVRRSVSRCVRRTISRTQTRTQHRTVRRTVLIFLRPSVRLSVGVATAKNNDHVSPLAGRRHGFRSPTSKFECDVM